MSPLRLMLFLIFFVYGFVYLAGKGVDVSRQSIQQTQQMIADNMSTRYPQ